MRINKGTINVDVNIAHQPIRKKAIQKEVKTCRECGCTDLHACHGGCFWIGLDLCSACYQKLKEDPKAENPNIAKELIALLKTSGIDSKGLAIEILQNLIEYEI